ncbi:MAG: hypothetical protein K9J17_17905 [Flavobacteriales bacterium]|nr:hypothetical protein [Flavobacteriales bacterium]
MFRTGQTSKNAIVALFLVLFLLPFAGTQTWLLVRRTVLKEQIKHELMAKSDREGLVSLSFDVETAKNELRWEHSSEFEYKGQMYDVVEVELMNGVTCYWCWPDNEETALNMMLQELLAFALGNDEQHQTNQELLTDFYASLFLGMEDLKQDSFVEHGPKHYLHRTHLGSSLQFSPDTPPPDLG